MNALLQPFLQKLEEVLKVYLKETYLPPHRAKTPGWTHHDLKFFAKGASLLSTAFTEGRAEIPKNYFNKKEFRSGFLLYFLLPTFVKIWKCLEQTPPHLKNRPLKILDLGCGPATASLACSTFFQNQPLEIFGYEQNANIKKDALALWKRLAPPHHHFHFTQRPILTEKIDLAIASYFFSELPFAEQMRLGCEVLKRADVFIVIEPALQKTTRQLMALRDKILERRWAQVLAPCLHQKNCPMLAANQRDWCHFYIDWKCPQLIREADQIVGNKHDYLKMAYMVFSSLSLRAEAPAKQHGGSAKQFGGKQSSGDIWRVVSSPLISKGKRELILCGACGLLKKIERLGRDRTVQNAAFDQIRRGDIIEWPWKERVEKEDKIHILTCV